MSFAVCNRSPLVALTVIAIPPHAGSFNRRSLHDRDAHSDVPKFLTVASSAESALDFRDLRLPVSKVPGFAFSLGVWKIRMTAPSGPVTTWTRRSPPPERVSFQPSRGAWPSQPGPEILRVVDGGASVGAEVAVAVAVALGFFGAGLS